MASDAEVCSLGREWRHIARLHNDYTTDENFWHDGAWPPYDEKGMAEMRRVIAACHRHNIKVVPYFSIHEFHPRPGLSGNEKQWARTKRPAGSVYHNLWGKGEFALRCAAIRLARAPQAGYRESLPGAWIRRHLLRWVMELAATTRTMIPSSSGTDGVIDLLAWTRRLVSPSGTLILHLYGKMPSIAFEDFADLW